LSTQDPKFIDNTEENAAKQSELEAFANSILAMNSSAPHADHNGLVECDGEQEPLIEGSNPAPKIIFAGPEEAISPDDYLVKEIDMEAEATIIIDEQTAGVTEGASVEGNTSQESQTAVEDKKDGGIEILVQMAKSGEIDPKNIDIIDLTDRFLRAIAAAPKENLRQSGKTLFHASVLLRMKAEALLFASFEEFEGSGDDFLDFDETDGTLIYDSNNAFIGRQITIQDLERALVRRTNTKHMRQRKVTLEQLIDALREAEKLDKERPERERRVKAVIDLEGHSEVNDFSDILDLAHDEDIEVVIGRVEQIVAQYLLPEERMALTNIIEKLAGRGDWVDAFLAVLFLSNAGKINLEQEQFYGPLYLLRSSPHPESAAYVQPVQGDGQMEILGQAT
jgi:segregation and condensation protein A